MRDFLLGRIPKDYDVATNARPEEVQILFGRRRTLAVGASFGVMIVRGSKEEGQVEVATFRTDESYSDGRRPDSVRFTTPKEDAQRRDFTINGMFYDPIEQSVLDFVGGEADLSRGVVRAIGIPADRMREDKLRMLRAVRFTATMDFELDAATADAIRAMAEEIHVVSAERIAQEWKRMLGHASRMHAVKLAHHVGLLTEIFPELMTAWNLTENHQTVIGDESPGEVSERTLHMLQLLQSPSFELVMAALLHTVPGSVREICLRLKLSNKEANEIVWLVDHQSSLVDAAELPLSELKKLLSHRYRDGLLALFRVCVLAKNRDLSDIIFCEEYLQRTPEDVLNPPLLISGDDLVQLGMQPGKQFRKWLDAVRDAQLNEELESKEDALKWIQSRISDTGC